MRVTLLSFNDYLYFFGFCFVFFANWRRISVLSRIQLEYQNWFSRVESLAFPFALLNKIRLSDDVSGLVEGLKVVSLLCYLCINIHSAPHWGCEHLCINLSVRDVILIPFSVGEKRQLSVRIQGAKIFFVCLGLFFCHIEFEWNLPTGVAGVRAAVEQCASWCGLCHICLACSCLEGLKACQFCCRGHFSSVTSHTL